MSFRQNAFDPTYIVSQIVCLQATYYVCLAATIVCLDLLIGAPISLHQLLWHKEITTSNVVGWTLMLSFLISSLLCAYFQVFIVQRAKLCFDFTCTLHAFHLIATSLYSASIPLSFTWWSLSIVSILIMSLGAEYLCMQEELKPIKVGSSSQSSGGDRIELRHLSQSHDDD
ncbi:integral membrane protein S linking to the trans Golgi network-domain-containing protein [Chytridium lagenaria]|nr:integral membrane protein S linking to the trans Golgi network-domain-containing protein [Chytridium lagenaria]